MTWISTSERLPAPDTLVWVYLPDCVERDILQGRGSLVKRPAGMRLGYYLAENMNEWRVEGSLSSTPWNVTHWAKLPDRPEEEHEES
jgi:hypothetical protein